jgi:hypothetical protein
VHDPPSHGGRCRRASARPRLSRGDRQRRLRLVGLDHAVRDALDRGRALSRAPRALRHDDRLHEQSLLRLHARLRQPRVDVRGRGADGRARGSAPPRSPRDPSPQRDALGRRQPARRRRTRSTRARRRRVRAGGAASAMRPCSTSAAARGSIARTAAAPS